MSCGDLFSPRIKVHDDYFLLKEEGQSRYSLYFRTKDDDYIRRIHPPIERYMKVGDSLFVAQTIREGKVVYEILNFKEDTTLKNSKVYSFNKKDFLGWCAENKIDHRLMKTVQ